MPTTVGALPQYQVLMALSATPTTLAAVTSRLVSCSITRGRTDELGTMQAGQMTLVLDNRDGAFSPDNGASPYAGYLVPGRRVQINARFDTATAWNPLFYGYIDSIRPEDNGPLDSNIVFQSIDWLGLMNIKNITGNVTSGGAGPHDLINWWESLIALVDPTATQLIVNPTDGTSQNLLDYAYTNANALQALNDFAAAVRGVVFVSAGGTVCATANGGTASSALFNNYFVFDQQGINPAANVVPYTNMDYDLTTQYLYNDITVTATNTWEGSRNAQDAASIAAYGKRSLNLQFPYMDIGQAAPMANTLMLAYRNPKPRVHALTIDVDGTTGITQSGHTAADLLFGLELTAPVSVAKSAPGSLGINRTMVVEGIKHDIKPDFGGVGVMHEITLQLTETTNINPAVWKLGVSKLGIDTVLAYGPLPFAPTTITGCQLYLRSDIGVTTSGTTVTQWNDQSGNSRHATPVGGPTRVLSVQNGYPSVRLNGTNQYFTLASSAMGGANWTVFVVFKASDVTAGRVPYAEENNVAYRGVVFGSANFEVIVNDGSVFTNPIDPTTLTTGTCYVATGTSANGNPGIAYVNGDAGTSASNTISAFTPTRFTIGAFNNYTAYFFVGDLLCLIVYNNVLSSADRITVRDGLKTLYAAY
jgi:hypothetical protein